VREFKVGDRVRYYGVYNDDVEVSAATVLEVREDGMVYVQLDKPAEPIEGVAVQWAHPKQVRRLVKRERRRLWIRKKDWAPSANINLNALTFRPVFSPLDQYLEFVEVRRK
jgi:hypothetical protein